MTTTVEVIFAGLMLLSQPEGDGKAVVVFPEDDEHKLELVLLTGTTNCPGVKLADGTKFPGVGDTSRLRLKYHDSYGRLYWVTGAIGTVPKTEKEAEYLAWLPSLSSMVLGDSRLREGCRDPDDHCEAAESRFFIERGKISTCHFVHPDLMDSTRLQLYKLPYGQRRALADAFKLHDQIDAQSIELQMGEDPCSLFANGNAIKLLVSYAPVEIAEDGHEHVSHFPRLHRLQRRLYQRMDSSKPEPKGVQGGAYPGACEDDFLTAQRLFANPQNPRVIHSPTECGGATQP